MSACVPGRRLARKSLEAHASAGKRTRIERSASRSRDHGAQSMRKFPAMHEMTLRTRLILGQVVAEIARHHYFSTAKKNEQAAQTRSRPHP